MSYITAVGLCCELSLSLFLSQCALPLHTLAAPCQLPVSVLLLTSIVSYTPNK